MVANSFSVDEPFRFLVEMQMGMFPSRHINRASTVSPCVYCYFVYMYTYFILFVM